jgi:hypothetical protein
MPLKTFKELGGETWKIRRLVSKDSQTWSAFNPSIGIEPDGSVVALIRSSNYVIHPFNGSILIVEGNKVQNKVYFSRLDENFKPISLNEVHISNSPFPLERGVEDAKLYYRDNNWYFTGVVKESVFCNYPKIATFKMTSPSSAEMVRLWDITSGLVEKNWMVPPSNGKFDFIYGPNTIIKNDKVIEVRGMTDEIKKIRGTSNLLELGDGSYLAVVHEAVLIRTDFYYDATSFGYKQGFSKLYSHRFAMYSDEGVLIKMSDKFCFDIVGIEFGSGLIEKDGYFYVSYGQKDIRSHIAKIDKELALSMLKDV